MSHTPRTPRAVDERRAIGRRLRAYRIALGLTNRDLAEHTSASKGQVYAAESATTDIVTGTLIDLAAAVGLRVALAADYHLPLLNLTADEVDALIAAADLWSDHPMIDTFPQLRSALDKLTTSTEETP